MCISVSYIIILLITIGVAWVGRYFAKRNMQWYHQLVLPGFNPKKEIYSFIWPFIFLTTSIAAMYLWGNYYHTASIFLIMFLLSTVALTNVGWCYTFFERHEIGFAIGVNIIYIALLAASMSLIGKISFLALVLLVPHLLWVIFALFLNISVWLLNR